jgi:CheY-like chemotaxis protein
MERARSGPGQFSILLVEDDEASRISLGTLLQRAGYRVRTAPDFRLALELLEGDQSIDLLLTDIVMPDRVNGLALARMARLRRPGVKLLYVTGYDIPGVESEALGPLLRKPFGDDDLLDAVRQVLKSC